MRFKLSFLLLLFVSLFHAQSVQDNFEGNGTITSWFGDDCLIEIGYTNPYQVGLNLSQNVLKYLDIGGQYANLRFDADSNFDLSGNSVFTFKIYVPSSSLSGNQSNQVSLKLQNGSSSMPWSTQSEIIKPIVLDQWQELSFDFQNDTYINLDNSSLPPSQRTDFNRVVIQVNGENNADQVIAYIDDFYYNGTITLDPDYNMLVWSDEFNDAGSVDTSKWFHQTQLIAGNSWANGELQHYTNRLDNSYVSEGTLKIKAIKEQYTDQNETKSYTSARLNSKFSFKYGRVEVRAKLPSVSGTWPAIWLLGKNINEDGTYWDNEGFGTSSWPFCGEIDIMEPNIAKTEILGTWHWNNGNGYEYNSGYIPFSNNQASQNFNIYALEWNSSSMKIFLNDVLVNQMTTVDPFNEEFFILLNLAMGGNLGGEIDTNFTNDTMEIDYVRVYQQSTLSNIDTEFKKNLKIFPNPTNNELTIKVPISYIDSNVSIYSVLGNKLIGYKQNNKIEHIDTSKLSKGLYIVKIENQNKFATFKLIKN